jgi:hypothetical protein
VGQEGVASLLNRVEQGIGNDHRRVFEHDPPVGREIELIVALEQNCGSCGHLTQLNLTPSRAV